MLSQGLRDGGDEEKFFRWVEIGTARYDEHSCVAHVFLDRLPVGGFNGHLYLSPQGVEPPPPEPDRSGPANKTTRRKDRSTRNGTLLLVSVPGEYVNAFRAKWR